MNNVEERESGGTHPIMGIIRSGLTFQLKQSIGLNTIQKREHDFSKRAIDSLKKNEKIHLLGNLQVDRLAIISFLIQGLVLFYYNGTILIFFFLFFF